MERFSCDSNDKSCMYSDYDSCLSTKLDVSNIVDISINSISSDDTSGGSDIYALLMYQISARHKSDSYLINPLSANATKWSDIFMKKLLRSFSKKIVFRGFRGDQ